MIKLGVNSILFGVFDYETAAKYISLTGYDGVEIAALKDMCEHLELDNWKSKADELLEINEKYDLEFLGTEVATLDEERLVKAFEASAYLGIPVVNIGSGGQTGNEEDFQRQTDRIAKMAEKAGEYGVILGLKPHVGAAIHDVDTVLRALEKIKSPSLGINLDPSHIHRSGDESHEVLSQLIDHVKHIHIRDCVGRDQGPGTAQDQVCGRGDVDLFAYCKEMVKGGYSGNVCLEIIGANVANPADAWANDIKGEFGLEEVVALAAESYGYLNACFKKLGAR